MEKKYYLITALMLIAFTFIIIIPVKNLTGNATENPFNLEVEIPGDYQKIAPGDTLWFTTKILNFANKNRVDVTLEYSIFDENEEKIITRTETVAIETQASFVGKIELPDDTSPGSYMLTVTMVQANGESSLGKASFQVKIEEDFQSFLDKNKFIILIVLGLIVIFSFIFLILPILKNSIENMKIRKKVKELIRVKSLYY